MTTETLKDELIAVAPDTDSADERMRDALEAPEPAPEGESPGQVVQMASGIVASGGDPAVPGGGNAGTSAVGGFVMEQLKLDGENGGWSWIWNQRSYERSKVLNYMLKPKLELRFEDGDKRFVWTTRQPKDAEGNVVYPWRGTHKCFLHADHPEREYHASLGLPTCPKSNLASSYEARRHAQHRHSGEWGVIEEERDSSRRELDRRAQLAQIAMAEKLSGLTPTVEVAETPAQEIGKFDVKITEGSDVVFDLKTGICPHCNFESKAKRAQSRKVILKGHIERQHSEV